MCDIKTKVYVWVCVMICHFLGPGSLEPFYRTVLRFGRSGPRKEEAVGQQGMHATYQYQISLKIKKKFTS